MRHLQRTHRVSIAWLHERFKEEEWHNLKYILTDYQAADIFTKPFYDKLKWEANLELIHIHKKGEEWNRRPRILPESEVTRKKTKKK